MRMPLNSMHVHAAKQYAPVARTTKPTTLKLLTSMHAANQYRRPGNANQAQKALDTKKNNSLPDCAQGDDQAKHAERERSRSDGFQDLDLVILGVDLALEPRLDLRDLRAVEAGGAAAAAAAVAL